MAYELKELGWHDEDIKSISSSISGQTMIITVTLQDDSTVDTTVNLPSSTDTKVTGISNAIVNNKLTTTVTLSDGSSVTSEAVDLPTTDISGKQDKEINLTGFTAKTVEGALTEAKAAGETASTNLTAHINNKENPHEVTAAQVGLGNVTNTSDADKPVSTAQQTALDAKLDKVATTTINPQFYAKEPDGSQVMKEIKGSNGITVDAASDNKSLEVKVGDRINITGEQTLSIGDWIKFVSDGVIIGNDIGGLKLTYSPADSDFVTAFDFDYTNEMACRLLVGGQETGYIVEDMVGPNISWNGVVLIDRAPGVWAKGLNLCYEITGVPADATSGTLHDNKSFTYLKKYPDELRLLFNKEYYNLSDNQHTTGTLVFSHVGYENTQLIVKTITITLATRGWVLTTVKPVEAAYYVELNGTSGTLTEDQVNKLVADTDSYVLYTDANSNTYKLCRNILTPNALTYSVVVNEQEYRVMITLATYEWQYTKVELQNVADRVSTIGTGSTVMYPNTKAVYDADQATLTAAKAYADSILGAEQVWLQKIDSGEGV